MKMSSSNITTTETNEQQDDGQVQAKIVDKEACSRSNWTNLGTHVELEVYDPNVIFSREDDFGPRFDGTTAAITDGKNIFNPESNKFFHSRTPKPKSDISTPPRNDENASSTSISKIQPKSYFQTLPSQSKKFCGQENKTAVTVAALKKKKKIQLGVALQSKKSPCLENKAKASAASPKTKKTIYTELKKSDVLIGRGGGTNNHSGNKAFRAKVDSLKDEYSDATDNETKRKISQGIVDDVNSNGGNFVKAVENGCYEVVPNKVAREKTRQCLTEKRK